MADEKTVLKTGKRSPGSNFSGTFSASKSAFTKPKSVATSSVFAGCNGYCFALIQHGYLAVRQVTQDNRGKHTPGVDGVASLTPNQRMRMVRGCALEPASQLPFAGSTSQSQ